MLKINQEILNNPISLIPRNKNQTAEKTNSQTDSETEEPSKKNKLKL